jgi:hypothetical protein
LGIVFKVHALFYYCWRGWHTSLGHTFFGWLDIFMTWHMEEYFSILLMRSVTTLAHFSRSPSSCAHGLGNQVDGIGKQHMVLAHVLMEANHFGTSS